MSDAAALVLGDASDQELQGELDRLLVHSVEMTKQGLALLEHVTRLSGAVQADAAQALQVHTALLQHYEQLIILSADFLRAELRRRGL